jgi:uncharacterized protein (DUF2147 family)
MRHVFALIQSSRRGARIGLSLAFVAGAACAGEKPAEPSAAGFWQATNDDGTPSAWFQFSERDGLYEGRIAKTFRQPGEAAEPPLCAACTGERKNAPILGLAIVTGMKRNGQKYDHGSILDPRDGTIYHARMEVSPDGQKLFLRGYVGIDLFGQTQTWTRLPDDALPAVALPGAPAAKTRATPPVKASASGEKAPPSTH